MRITEECIKCGTCAGACPMDAISEGESMFEIDQDVCISCGACQAACPMEAIVED